MTILELSDVSKSFGEGKARNEVLSGVNLKVEEGEFIAIVGFSGSGKSTLISLLAGLSMPDSGAVLFRNREIAGPGPERGVVFQSYSLMPWLSVRANVALAVDSVHAARPKAERRQIVSDYIDMVGLTHAVDRRPAELSGGMRQRVAVARALAMRPEVLLLDEPFGMLDSLTRWELQEVLMDVWKRTQVTAICVTHDVDEAILLADRVVMMSNGPNARIGNIMEVNLPRPRSRKALLAHPDYYAYREELLDFLEAYEGGADPSPEQLSSIQEKRAARIARQDTARRVAAAE